MTEGDSRSDDESPSPQPPVRTSDRERLKRREAVLAEIQESRRMRERLARRHAQLARIRQALQTRSTRP